MHIIYIEDDLGNVALVERVARMQRDSLTVFYTAEDALRHIKPGDADLILTDIDFGEGMSGLELTHALRAKGVSAPIVAITAFDLQEYMRYAEEAGGNDYLVKPVNVPDLVELLNSYR